MLIKRGRRTKAAVATALGTVFFMMIASGVIGSLLYAFSNQVEASQEAVSVQRLLGERQEEYLNGYTVSPGKILVSDNGSVQSEILSLAIIGTGGSVMLCPSAQCTISPTLPATLAPSAAAYFVINPVPSDQQMYVLTTLGHSFYVSPYPPPNIIQYYALTIESSPQNSGTTGPSSGTYYYPAGAQVSITACASSGYSWNDWTGTGSGSYTGDGRGGQCNGDSLRNLAVVSMDGNITETANF